MSTSRAASEKRAACAECQAGVCYSHSANDSRIDGEDSRDQPERGDPSRDLPAGAVAVDLSASGGPAPVDAAPTAKGVRPVFSPGPVAAPIVVIVTGSRRDDVDPYTVHRELDAIKEPIRLLVQGGAPGVDKIARDWAFNRGIPVATHEARWKELGQAAGPRRNLEILDGHPDGYVFAFPGPRSRGTWGTVKGARERKMPVKVVGD